MTKAYPITADTSPAGLDALADHLAVAWQLSQADRDRLRAKLAVLEGVVLHPERNVAVRMVPQETVGDWQRVEFVPWLRPVT
jgi:hypothetical protein